MADVAKDSASGAGPAGAKAHKKGSEKTTSSLRRCVKQVVSKVLDRKLVATVADEPYDEQDDFVASSSSGQSPQNGFSEVVGITFPERTPDPALARSLLVASVHFPLQRTVLSSACMS